MPVRRGESIDPDATRQRILEVSEELFYRHGIESVGIADIAGGASASKMSIYKNFGSKNGLVEAVLTHRSERVMRWLDAGTAGAGSGVARVLAIFDLLAGWFAEERFRGCAMVGAAAEDRMSGGAPTTLARRHLQRYRELLGHHLEEAGVPGASTVARRLLLVIEGATLVSAVDGDPDAATDARAVAEALLTSATARAST